MAKIYIEYSNSKFTKVGKTTKTVKERHQQHVTDDVGYYEDDAKGDRNTIIDYRLSTPVELGNADENDFHTFLESHGVKEKNFTVEKDGAKVKIKEIYVASSDTIKKYWLAYKAELEKKEIRKLY